MSEFLARLAAHASDSAGSAGGSSGGWSGGSAGGNAAAVARPRLPERFAPPDPPPGETSLPVSETSLPVGEESLKPAEESQKAGERSQKNGEESITVDRLDFETLALQPTGVSAATQPTRAGDSVATESDSSPTTSDSSPRLTSLSPPPPTGHRTVQPPIATLTPQPPAATLSPRSVVPLPTSQNQAEKKVPDVLHVTIGRIDVRIPAAPISRPSPAKSADPSPLSLADYLDGKRAPS